MPLATTKNPAGRRPRNAREYLLILPDEQRAQLKGGSLIFPANKDLCTENLDETGLSAQKKEKTRTEQFGQNGDGNVLGLLENKSTEVLDGISKYTSDQF